VNLTSIVTNNNLHKQTTKPSPTLPKMTTEKTEKISKDQQSNSWQEYETNIAQILSSTDHPELVDFPNDDIKINIIPRTSKLPVRNRIFSFD
jgi:hypothetical protein